MTDPAAQAEPQAPAPTPPAPAISPEIEAYVARRVQELSDQRVAGLQSTFDKKLAALDRKVKASVPSYAEDDDGPDNELQQELAEARRRAEFWEAVSAYDPETRDWYQRILNAPTIKAQAALVKELLSRSSQPQTEPVVPQAPAPPPAADIDPNNPMRAGTQPNEPGDLSQSMVEQILKGITTPMAEYMNR